MRTLLRSHVTKVLLNVGINERVVQPYIYTIWYQTQLYNYFLYIEIIFLLDAL